MMDGKLALRLGVALAVAGAAMYPLAAQTPELGMLGGLAKGEWELRVRGDGPSQRICVRNGHEFLQLRHRQGGCDRFIVKDEADEVTVQYTCRGNGYGRTNVRREGNGLIQIRSQGIQGGLPFSVQGEARRIGSC
jgi:hypothetical protein